MRMRTKFPVWTFPILSAGLVLRAEESRDEQMKAKRAAEAMHVVASAVAGTNRLVTDKPYSAEAVTETVQTLGDGNRIVRHNVTRHYRDRSGRTRREQSIETLGPSSPVAPMRMIVISDPVAKADYILDPVRQTVRKFGRLEIQTPKTSGGAESGGRGERNLGKRTIEGLECIGTRNTVTIPVGQIGNERPVVAMTETWYSPAIEAVVSSTTSDPRFGEIKYSLHNVVLTEQALPLFEPPAGYKVEFEGKAGVMMKRVDKP